MSAPAVPIADFPRSLDTTEAAPIFDIVNGAMKAVASLKLTVALFVAGIFVVYVGTVAQQEADIWQVVREYFHAWVMWVDVNLLFPDAFFPFMPDLPLPRLPAPGGLTVGALMAINLLAAHGWRFKIQSSGLRLALGIAVSLFGLAVGGVIIWAGHNAEGFQAQPPFSWDSFWTVFLVASSLLIVVGSVAYLYFGVVAALRKPSLSLVEAVILTLIGAAITAVVFLLGWGFLADPRPSDEALRIVWQLAQGGLAGLILLVGCILVFRKRGGMVLLHLGIGLLMFNELWVAMDNRERQVFMQEGQTVNYLRDTRTLELAIVNRAAKETDEHVVIPRSMLEQNFRANQKLQKQNKPLVYIEHPLLPTRLAVVGYYKNAEVRDLKAGERSPATKGRGVTETIEERPIAKGTDTDGGVDYAAAYVRFADKAGKDLGTYMLSQLVDAMKFPERVAEEVEAGGKTYHVFLRFQREYKPYTLSLVDVRKDDYVASDTPRNFSSDVRLNDKGAGVDQTVHIKMNDPLRYRGDTFYQSGYHPSAQTGGAEATTLQVVHNRGWMIPYVACMVVVLGMIAHFLITVTRFISRREAEETAAGEVIAAVPPAQQITTARHPFAGKASEASPARGKPTPKKGPPGEFNWSLVGLPALAAGIMLAWMAYTVKAPRPPEKGLDLVRFGQLPVAHEGRIKPLDTLARNSLRALSLRETVKTEKGRIPATQWLLEIISGSEQADHYKVFRIDNPDVLKVLGLKPRSGFLYSLGEVLGNSEDESELKGFYRQVEAAGKTPKEQRTLEQNKLLELHERLSMYMLLVQSFGAPRNLPEMPTKEAIQQNPQVANKYIQAFVIAVRSTADDLRRAKAPRPIPIAQPASEAADDAWQLYPVAWSMAFAQQNLTGGEVDPAVVAFDAIKAAYRKNDQTEFNRKLAAYETHLARTQPAMYSAKKANLEAYFNHVSPFYAGITFYVIGFLLAIFGWLLCYRPLNWAAFTVILLTFLFHTAALAARIYISGRPPVTNLYSSAVFIGWAAVLAALVLELIFRIGLGNIVAAKAGFATLIISYFLAAGGDTITVLQAVLDTQFWLATHVVCITLGYAATYLAGLFGILYVLLGLTTPLVNEKMRKDIGRMIYGITCFAILFSFFGTVLGGLWADDSWGRFWGWDPKENGALIIVLWNALILHARWDKLVGDRGLAVLALGGNIVTSWSWFGVNQLGIGLHSYGFTSGVAIALGTFVASQLVLIALGCLPKEWWWSFRAQEQNRPLKAAIV